MQQNNVSNAEKANKESKASSYISTVQVNEYVIKQVKHPKNRLHRFLTISSLSAATQLREKGKEKRQSFVSF